MLKKPQFLVVAVAAALAVLVALATCPEWGKLQSDRSAAGSFSQAATSDPLPCLSESTTPSSPDEPGDQTDNSTAITSGGVVRASFTVVSQPDGNQQESTAAESQTMPNNQSLTTAPVRTRPGGLASGWALLASILLTAIAAAVVLVLLRFRKGSSFLRGDSR